MQPDPLKGKTGPENNDGAIEQLPESSEQKFAEIMKFRKGEAGDPRGSSTVRPQQTLGKLVGPPKFARAG